ncbi:MAG: hypothetical protein J3R72DRAFT_460297 [Linnemannia gamsii]|nr:MAG: hypothetical protein J3R72DRAFT_460297 [Linnemannia gamsii]
MADNNDDDNNTEPICAICLAPYTGRVYLSPCLHSFCASCLSAWVDVSVLCPLCKSKPEKIHWGVDTALGVVHTINVRTSLPFYSYALSGSGDIHWREALKNVAAQSKQEQEQEEEDDDRHEGDAAMNDAATVTSRASDSEDEDDGESTQQQDRERGVNKRSRSRSESRSRSRSTTPIDSHPYLYDSGELFSSHSTPIGQMQGDVSATGTTCKAAQNGEQVIETSPVTGEVVRIPSRQEVYALGMEPHPEHEFPLADEIRPIDITFLTPFLQQDLVVLTNSGARPLDPIILDLICSLFAKHGSKASSPSSRGVGGHIHKRQALGVKNVQAQQPLQQGELIQWSIIEQEVAQWIALTPSKENWNEVNMAQLFVREMRRAVKKRWTVKRWNNAVLYKASSFNDSVCEIV